MLIVLELKWRLSVLFDSHSHLDADQFDHDRDLMIDRAKKNGSKG